MQFVFCRWCTFRQKLTEQVSNNFLGGYLCSLFCTSTWCWRKLMPWFVSKFRQGISGHQQSRPAQIANSSWCGVSISFVSSFISLILGTNLHHKAQLKFSYLIFLWLCTRFPSPKVSTALILLIIKNFFLMHVSMVATAIMQLRTMGFNGILVTQKCLTPGDLFSLALYTPIQGEAVPFSCNNISGRNYILRKLF